MRALLMGPARTGGHKPEKHHDRDCDRERDQRRSLSVFHVPQRQTPSLQRMEGAPGYVFGPRPRRMEVAIGP